MIPTPGQPKKHYGIGAVNHHSGEIVVMIQKRKKREQIAQLLQNLVDKHPMQTIYVAWHNADTHSGGKVEEVLRAAAARLVLLYLPTYSPWLNPIEMLWRHLPGRLPIASYLSQLKNLLKLLMHFLNAIMLCPLKFCLSLALIPHNIFACT